MPTAIRIGDYVSSPEQADLAHTGYSRLEDYELSAFLGDWKAIHEDALLTLPDRIHPSAVIHPTANIGPDVIVGPGVRVHEFSTVRKGSVLCAGASVGFGCEVTQTFIGEGARLGHSVGVGHSVIGTGAHLSAQVVVAAISLLNADMRHPITEIVLRADGDDEPYRCKAPAFGALIGDRTQTGSTLTLGPGLAVGRDCRLSSGIHVGGRIIPSSSFARQARDLAIERRRPGGQPSR
ncbi:transferase [Streptomyces sp. NPDC059989]|uniref:transferase n=1 Tax=Streptomyces sp. NPDC059989 TaxID=3347026 RepID=UPI00369E5B6D